MRYASGSCLILQLRYVIFFLVSKQTKEEGIFDIKLFLIAKTTHYIF